MGSITDRIQELLRGNKTAQPRGARRKDGGGYYVFDAGWIPQQYDPLNWNNAIKTAQFNSVVFACLSVLARTFPEPPLKVYDRKTGVELPEHPARQLLSLPYNPEMMGIEDEALSEAEMALYTIYYLAVGGNCYWYKIRAKDGRLLGFLPLHAGQVFPLRAYGKRIAGYNINILNTGGLQVAPSEVVHLKWNSVNMTDNVLALSPLVAIAAETDATQQAMKYVASLLKNDAMPRTIVTAPADVQFTEDTLSRLKASFKNSFGGANFGAPMFLEGGVTVERLGLNLQELNMETLATIPEARIAGAFGVPPMLAGLYTGLKHSTYSNFEQAMKAFTQYTLVPMWRLIADQVEESLRPEFEDGAELTFKHDLTHVASLHDDTKELQVLAKDSYASGIMTLNEARAKLGLPEVENGDAFQYQLQPSPAPPPAIKKKPKLLKEGDTTSYKLFENESEQGATDEVKMKYWQKYDVVMKDAATTLQNAIEKVFATLERGIISKVDGASGIQGVIALFDPSAIVNALATELQDSVKQAIIASMKEAVADLGESWNDVRSQFDDVIRAAVSATIETIKPIGNTLKQDMTDLLKNNTDKSKEELKALISQKFSEYASAGAWRAERIATTTATFINGKAQETVFSQLGFKTQWLTERDAKVRLSHRALDGEFADKDGFFTTPSGDKAQHPGGFGVASEDCNCRCVLFPVRDE